ncbi:MAG: FapA family protein [bacterium]|nr:FapA family protein [bacterium]
MSRSSKEENTVQQLHLQLVASNSDQWRVRARLKETDLQSMELTVNHLRSIKSYLSEKFTVPVEALVFAEVTKKEEDGAWLYTTFLIRRTDIGAGDPKVRLLPGIDRAGREYPDIKAVLDVLPLDAEGEPTTLQSIKAAVRAARIDPRLVPANSCEEAYQILIDQSSPVINYILAEGKIPECGNDAIVETLFESKPQPALLQSHLTLQRVIEGDILCRRYPAQPGKASGYNIRGEELKPVAGWEIDLLAGDGVEIRGNGTLAIAKRDGSVEYRWSFRNVVSLDGEKELPVSITVSVVPVRVVDAKDVLTLATDDAIEIVGTIRSGSEIISSNSITINGNVEDNVRISSQSNIVVKGDVKSAELMTDRQIVIKGDVGECVISARENVTIQGTIRNCKIHADTIVADTYCGSALIANQSVRLKRIETDESGMISTISLGIQGFNALRVKDNETFIAQTEEKIRGYEATFGEDILEGLTSGSVQSSFVKYLSKLRRQPDYTPLSQQELLRLRSLLESIPATRMMLLARKQEKISLERQMEEQKDRGAASLIIEEHVNGDAFIQIDNAEGVLSSPIKGRTEIRANEDGTLEIT